VHTFLERINFLAESGVVCGPLLLDACTRLRGVTLDPSDKIL